VGFRRSVVEEEVMRNRRAEGCGGMLAQVWGGGGELTFDIVYAFT
jgi:hypothetical protein